MKAPCLLILRALLVAIPVLAADSSGVSGGLIVAAGCDVPESIAGLRTGDSCVVQALDTDPDKVAKVRAHLAEQDLCGPVSARTFDGEHLPYVDNLVNLYVRYSPFQVDETELLRILVPGGIAIDSKDAVILRKPWPRPPQERPAGYILVTDGKHVYGYNKDAYSTDGSHIGMPDDHNKHLQLFASSVDARTTVQTRLKGKGKTYRQKHVDYLWTSRPGVLAIAMVLAGDHLFVAGPPHYDTQTKWSGLFGDAEYRQWLEKEYAAYMGKEGGRLLAIAPKNGHTLSEYKLDCPPVFDGMAVANGCLYLSLKDGSVVCFGK